MTLNDHISTNPVLGTILWAVCHIFAHLMGRFQSAEFPIFIMQFFQIVFWMLGSGVAFITIWEWSKKNIPFIKKRFK